MSTYPTREELRDELSGWPIHSGYSATTVGIEDATGMADAILALFPPVEKVKAAVGEQVALDIYDHIERNRADLLPEEVAAFQYAAWLARTGDV